MSAIPSITSSSLASIHGGFLSLDLAAGELTDREPAGPRTLAGLAAPASPAAPAGPSPWAADDQVEVRPPAEDSMLAGVKDLLLAKMQVGAGSALLHGYRQSRAALWELLKPDPP